MKQNNGQSGSQQWFSKIGGKGLGWLIPALLRRRIFGASVVLSLLAAFYWGVIASDRYVSEAHVIIQRTDMARGSTMDIGTLLSGAGRDRKSVV